VGLVPAKIELVAFRSDEPIIYRPLFIDGAGTRAPFGRRLSIPKSSTLAFDDQQQCRFAPLWPRRFFIDAARHWTGAPACAGVEKIAPFGDKTPAPCPNGPASPGHFEPTLQADWPSHALAG